MSVPVQGQNKSLDKSLAEMQFWHWDEQVKPQKRRDRSGRGGG